MSRYLLPLTVKWTRFDRAVAPAANAVAAIRRGSREGTLIDAGGDQDFIKALLGAMHAGDSIVRVAGAWNAFRPRPSRKCRVPKRTRSRCPTPTSPTPP